MPVRGPRKGFAYERYPPMRPQTPRNAPAATVATRIESFGL
jgi:hypothetical protein